MFAGRGTFPGNALECMFEAPLDVDASPLHVRGRSSVPAAQADGARLAFISRAKQLGCSLEEIADLVGI